MGISKGAIKRLKENFLDELVIFYLRGMNIVAPNEEGEISITAMCEAYVIDVDEDYFYVGTPDGAITRVIAHDTCQMVELVMPQDEVLMFEMPSEEDEVH